MSKIESRPLIFIALQTVDARAITWAKVLRMPPFVPSYYRTIMIYLCPAIWKLFLQIRRRQHSNRSLINDP